MEIIAFVIGLVTGIFIGGTIVVRLYNNTLKEVIKEFEEMTKEMIVDINKEKKRARAKAKK